MLQKIVEVGKRHFAMDLQWTRVIAKDSTKDIRFLQGIVAMDSIYCKLATELYLK